MIVDDRRRRRAGWARLVGWLAMLGGFFTALGWAMAREPVLTAALFCAAVGYVIAAVADTHGR